MAWGFECDDGWIDIIDQLCSKIQQRIDWKSRCLSDDDIETLQVVATQVKEKFGTLRFYYFGGDDVISGLVSMAETISGITCEACGNSGRTRTNGWHRTLCDSCDIKRAACLAAT